MLGLRGKFLFVRNTEEDGLSPNSIAFCLVHSEKRILGGLLLGVFASKAESTAVDSQQSRGHHETFIGFRNTMAFPQV